MDVAFSVALTYMRAATAEIEKKRKIGETTTIAKATPSGWTNLVLGSTEPDMAS